MDKKNFQDSEFIIDLVYVINWIGLNLQAPLKSIKSEEREASRLTRGEF